LDKNGKELNLTESECKEYQILENFRRKTITFWCNVQEHDYVLPYLFYPNLGEIKEFMTFHWALYMTNNKCTELPNYLGEEPKVYSFFKEIIEKDNPSIFERMFKSYLPYNNNITPCLCNPRILNDIFEYQEIIKKEFPRIQETNINIVYNY